MSAATFVGNLVEAYAHDSDDGQRNDWSADRTRWLVGLSLSIFERIEDVAMDWAASVNLDESYPAEGAQAVRRMYQTWLDRAVRILERADQLIAGSAPSREVTALLQATLTAKVVLSIPLERAAAEYDRQRREGHSKSIPMSEVRRAHSTPASAF